MQGKQAKIVSLTQERAILGFLDTTRYPSRDRVMFLLSMKAGLRAKEIASLTWAMVTDAQGQISDAIHVPNRASKGKTGGRTIPMHPEVQAALVMLQTWRGDMATSERPILFAERGGGCRPRPYACFSIGCIRVLGSDGTRNRCKLAITVAELLPSAKKGRLWRYGHIFVRRSPLQKLKLVRRLLQRYGSNLLSRMLLCLNPVFCSNTL